MPTFLLKFHGDLAPNSHRIPKAASEWDGGKTNVPRPSRTTLTGRKASSPPPIAPGDRVYLWVHDEEPGSNGAGLTAKAHVGAVDDRGPDDVEVFVNRVELIRPPVRYRQLYHEKRVRSEVGDKIVARPDRQTLHVADEHVAEWEEHYGWFAEQRALANARHLVEQHEPQLSQENQERFRQALARPGQGASRAEVVQRHRGRCAVSGEGSALVLDAAHVLGFAKHPEHRDDPRNGILLRADLHRPALRRGPDQRRQRASGGVGSAYGHVLRQLP